MFAKCIGSTTEKAEETLFSLIGPSKAAGTNRLYLRQIVQYADWIKTRHVQVQNVNASIAAYLAFICHSGATKSQLESSRAALKWFYGLFTGDSRSAESPLAGALASTVRRTATPVVHHLRCTREELGAIIAYSTRSGASLRDVRAGALFPVQFALFLRVSELACILRCNVSIDAHGLVLKIPMGKTDQEKNGPARPVVRTGSPLCPVTALERWLVVAPCSPFVFPNLTDPRNHMTDDSIRKELKRVRSATGIERHLTPHAMRGGAATAALSDGVPQSAVMTMGRWKSTAAFEAYVEVTPATLQGAASIL